MDDLFFIASKLISTLIRPESWVLNLVGFALLAYWRNAKRLGVLTLTSVLAASLAIAIFSLGDFVFRPLETRFPANTSLQNIDGILLLGGTENAVLTFF